MVMPQFSRIESIGAYVPDTVLSTADLLARLPDEFALDIEAITGIGERRIAGTSSLDLAVRAARDALAASEYRAADLDVVICCSITRTVEPGLFTLEPSLAARICSEIGASAALSFDVTNACAGMLTGIKILDAMIRAGAAQTGLVVSGEDITPISDTAVAEIALPYDPQFASLTVGDAGSAVILDVSTDPADRIEYIELFTAAGFAQACLGMPSDQRPGVALYTDNRTMHNESRYLLWMNAHRDFLDKRGSDFAAEGYDAMVHHQVSAPGIAFVQTIAEREFGTTMPPHLNVLAEYANTASTSHALVLATHIREKGIDPGTRVLLVPAASGVVGGFCSVTLHDAVRRVRAAGDQDENAAATTDVMRSATADGQGRSTIAGLAVADPGDETSAITLAARAGRAAIADAGCADDDIDVLIHVGVYRDDNIVEPAVAALVQQRIGIGLDYGRGDHTMYSFDLINGAAGVLDALAVADSLIACGAGTVLITAADAHPGGDAEDRSPAFPYGPTAAAVVVARAPDDDSAATVFDGLVAAAGDTSTPVGYSRIPDVGNRGRRSIVVDAPTVADLAPLVADVASRSGIVTAVPAAPAAVVTADGRWFTAPDTAHTAAPIIALASARDAGTDAACLVTAGGGRLAAAVRFAHRQPSPATP